MLKKTFLHVPGVGPKTERKLWKQGIRNWNQFIKNNDEIPVSSRKEDKITEHIEKSFDCLEQRNYSYLINNLPQNQHWRTYQDLKKKDDVCYLDIETTGLDQKRDKITVIGLYNGKESKIFVQGKNLDKFLQEFSKYSVVVSFNGKRFDLPFIEQKFGQSFNKFHVDLMYEMRKIGYSGGLKSIEKQLDVGRDDDLEDLDGRQAVRLWKKYKKGDKKALSLLVKYNRADIENLESLFDFAFERLKRKHFLSHIE